MTKKAKVPTCSICNQPYTNFGNNAAPFEGRCCDTCNDIYVVPARIAQLHHEDVKR